MHDAHAVAFPGCDASGDGIVLQVAFHRLGRQTESEMNRLLFQIEPGRIPCGESFHELVVPADEHFPIGIQSEFLAPAVDPEHEANA